MNSFARLPLAIGLAGTVLISAPAAFPCTTFLAQHDGQPVFGKNYDWEQDAGLVVVSPRGVRKTSLILSPQDKSAVWTSKYASLTFNQYGVEFPNSGINEKGLTVEIMWLDGTTYPAADSRPVLNELQWIQYALDNFSTVEELAAAAPSLRISQAYAKVHYMACDSTSDCASFENLDGQLVITRAKDMPTKTLANDTYADSTAYLKDYAGFGGTKELPTTTSSLDRFVRAASQAKVTEATTIPTSAFTILDSVAQPPYTQWSIVYVLKESAVHFRTQTSSKIKTVRLSSFALDCPQGRKVLDINTDATGDVSARFVDYSSSLNQQLLARSIGTKESLLPPGAVALLSIYPDTCVCQTSSDAGAIVPGNLPVESDGGVVLPADAVVDGVTDAAADALLDDSGAIVTTDASLADDGGGDAAPGATDAVVEAGIVPVASSDSGCSCTVTPSGRGSQGLAAALAMSVLGLVRRRRRDHAGRSASTIRA